MKIKSIMFGLCLTLAMLAFGSCADSKLEKTVEEVNRECPISIGSIGEITSFVLEDGNMVISCAVNESLINLDALKKNPKLMKGSVVSLCRNATGEMQTMFSLLAEEEAGWVLNYKGKSSGKEVSVSLTAQEIAEASATEDEAKNPMDFLRQQVELTNVQLPMKAADGMVITKLEIEGWYVVYHIELDENLYSVKAIEEDLQGAKNNIMNGLDKSDPAVMTFWEACKEANRGVAYKYIGKTSGKSCMVKIPASEL